MKDLDVHKKVAVLIDADNAQLSKLSAILDEISAHGHVLIKRAYGDWSIDALKNWKTPLNELAIQPIQQFAYTTGKNATDASMIIDAMDLLYSEKIDAFVQKGDVLDHNLKFHSSNLLILSGIQGK